MKYNPTISSGFLREKQILKFMPIAHSTLWDAQVIFDDWRQKLEDRLRNPKSEEHPAMLAHLGKYRSLFPKIALILHLADGNIGPIGKHAAKRACAWAMFLEAHARRIYHTATNRVTDLVARLQGRYSTRPHPMYVGQALRELGWIQKRDWTRDGGGRRIWARPIN